MKSKLLMREIAQVAIALGATVTATMSVAQQPSVPGVSGVPIVLAKPKLQSVTMRKASFTTAENIAFKVKFLAKQCVFNIEFRNQNGTVKSVGYFFQDPTQLEWAFNAPLSYWGVGAGTYILSAVPHTNPSVAGAKALACTGDSVSANLTIVESSNKVITSDAKAASLGKLNSDPIKADPPGVKPSQGSSPSGLAKATPPIPDKAAPPAKY